MKVYFKGKSVDIKVNKTNWLGKFLGLMFKSKNTGNLLFDFGYNGKPGIHSFFVFFNFLAVWLDSDNKVVDYGVVKPFSFLVQPKKLCRRLIEIPVNGKNKSILRFFVGKHKI